MNLIRNTEEKYGGKYIADPSREALEDIIQNHNLIEFPPTNGKYTWSNQRIGAQNIKERLDRILLQQEIVANFSLIKSKIIHITASDHKPIVLSMIKGENLGPLPFKYNKIWDQEEDFQSMVQENWAKEVWGSPHYVWETKLKNLRAAIKECVKTFTAKEKREKADLLEKMEKWNKEKEEQQPSTEGINYEKDMFRNYYKQNRKEEEEHRQRSRCIWLKSGDKITTFFHNCTKMRRARNQIDSIEVEGQVINKQVKIKEAAHAHFNKLLSSEPAREDHTAFISDIEKKISD